MSDNLPPGYREPPSDEMPAAALSIFRKYHRHFDGEIQGCCLLIADEIQRAIGGDVVAGYINYCHSAARRSHWWVELEGHRIDPMAAAAFDERDAPEWVEVHRDQEIFRSLLPEYEQWRVA